MKPEPVINTFELPGRVAAIRTAELRTRVDCIVERCLFEEGSDVRAGQALFRIDPRKLRADYQAAVADKASIAEGLTFTNPSGVKMVNF